ncbi:MAG: hypothetical protein LJE90_02420 [Betaproteobacteria bacterium]|jgi:hypothetical protein|nr:hypothetical protein [Betaproteobacteria bacterium]
MRNRGILQLLAVLAFVLLAGCATRSTQTEVTRAPVTLDEATTARLVADWQQQLCRYIAVQGGGDVAALAELPTLRSARVLRPARIQFAVLNAEAKPPDEEGWDVRGVLVGTNKRGPLVRHVFALGIVAYNDSLPVSVEDIRLVSLVPLDGALLWETSAPQPDAVARYREAYRGAGPSRFPEFDDAFAMSASGSRISVRELRSGADWWLDLWPDLRDTRGAPLSSVRTMPGGSAGNDCAPRAD